MKSELGAELVMRARRARALQARLAQEGALGPGYHPELEAADVANAAFFAQLLAERGWPKRSEVGDEGAAAAVALLQRAMSSPELQRKGLDALTEAAQAGEASLIDAAHFADRIAVYEGKPQLFGTQLDWDEAGQLCPARPIGDLAEVDARRAAIGLPPLDALLADARAMAEAPPEDLAERRAAFDAWAKRVGWR